MNISVFGGSKVQPGSPDYQMALELGRELAQAGHAVMTGGYIGMMEAVSRGAFEAGGQVIGVTCTQIESWRPVKPNAWLTEEVKCDTLIDRLIHLVTQCGLAIALPGGIGTLTEIALVWNLQVIGVREMPPVLLVGKGWQQTLQTFYQAQDAYIPAKDRAKLVFCAGVNEVLAEVSKYR